MRQGVAQDAGTFALGVVDMPQASQIGHAARVRVHAVVVLQLAGEFLLQHPARIVDEALEAVSCCLVEGHALSGSCIVGSEVAVERPDQHARHAVSVTGLLPFFDDGEVAETDAFAGLPV